MSQHSLTVKQIEAETKQIRMTLYAWGGVYFVQSSSGGPIKIGKSNNIHRRISSLKSGSPVELKLLRAIRTDDAGTLERELHERFADKKLRGEWFNITVEDIPKK